MEDTIKKAAHACTKSNKQILKPIHQELSVTEIPYDETDDLFADARHIIDSGRNAAYQSVNVAMLSTYWTLGKRIVVEEQKGETRAKYGSKIIQHLSEKLTDAYGKGFTSRALRQYRQFYLTFADVEKWNARVPFLSWTHFRSLMRVKNPEARAWYMNETMTQAWSARTLDRKQQKRFFKLQQESTAEKEAE